MRDREPTSTLIVAGQRLIDESRKRILVAWQERKRDELRHPFLGETIPLCLAASVQAQFLVRHLRGSGWLPGLYLEVTCVRADADNL